MLPPLLIMYQMSWRSPFLLHFLQDFTDLTASSASFIPTVTAISTSPDLQWMVQPVVSSVAPSHGAHPYTSSPSPAYSRAVMKSAMSRAHNKRGKVEQVIIIRSWSVMYIYRLRLLKSRGPNFYLLSCADDTWGRGEEKDSQREK